MEQRTESKHFFKVLIPGFDKKLRLPPAFCVKVSKEKSKWAKLKSCKGTWKVKVSRDGKGGICFERFEWPEFVESHSLSIGDFMVFEHIDRFNFNVLVFDPTACEKEFPIEPVTDHENSNEESPIDKPHFVATIQPHHHAEKFCLNIPIEFVRSNNLEDKTSAALRDERGRVWPTRLAVQKVGQFRIHMGKGWRDFYESNELKDGDVCVFYLTSNPPSSQTILFDAKINPSSL